MRLGGIGIRLVAYLALPTFLASINSIFNLVCTILPFAKTELVDIPFYEDALSAWDLL